MCQHIIGLLHIVDDSGLVDIRRLKFHVRERIEHNKNCRENGFDFLVWPEWTLKDYADGRKSTNLRRFTYCPECGEKIDWKSLRKGETDGSKWDNF